MERWCVWLGKLTTIRSVGTLKHSNGVISWCLHFLKYLIRGTTLSRNIPHFEVLDLVILNYWGPKFWGTRFLRYNNIYVLYFEVLDYTEVLDFEIWISLEHKVAIVIYNGRHVSKLPSIALSKFNFSVSKLCTICVLSLTPQYFVISFNIRTFELSNYAMKYWQLVEAHIMLCPVVFNKQIKSLAHTYFLYLNLN